MFKALFILTRIYYKEKVSRLSSPLKGFKVITCDYYYMLTTWLCFHACYCTMKLNMKFACFSHMQSYSATVSSTENICKKTVNSWKYYKNKTHNIKDKRHSYLKLNYFCVSLFDELPRDSATRRKIKAPL